MVILGLVTGHTLIYVVYMPYICRVYAVYMSY